MFVISLENIIESAIASGMLSSSGEVRKQSEDDDVGQLFKKEYLEALECLHDGVFAFLAFHPNYHSDVLDYVCSGRMELDSGDYIFVLFTLETAANTPLIADTSLFASWMNVTEADYPSYKFIKQLFENQAPPSLPGILLSERLSVASEPVYVGFRNQTSSRPLADLLADIFETGTKSYFTSKGNGQAFSEQLGFDLALKGLAYNRLGRLTLREHVARLFHWARSHSGDLVTVVKMLSAGGKQKGQAQA